MKFQALILFLFFTMALHAQYKYSSIATNYDTSLRIQHISLLDSTYNLARIFISGENHSEINQNIKIELMLLKYLNKTAGVRNLIIELGYARGYMLDKYINDDTSYFDLLKKNTYYKYTQFYKLLREYNQSLIMDQRIHVHGIDVERFPDDAVILLNSILSNKHNAPEEIGFAIETIKSYAVYCQKRFQRIPDYDDNKPDNRDFYYDFNLYRDGLVIDSILQHYSQNKTYFKQYCGSDSLVFDKVMNSLSENRLYHSYFSTPMQYIYRERSMFRTLSALLNQDSSAKFYGQFGRCHTSLAELNEECNWWAFSSLAKRLQESGFENKVINIGIFYKHLPAYYDEFFNSWGQDSAYMQYEKYLAKSTKEEFELFKVSNRDTALQLHFKFLLIDNYSNRNNVRSDGFYRNGGTLNIGLGQSSFDLGNLQSNLFNGKKGFNNDIRTYNIGISASDEHFNFNIDYTKFESQKRSGNNSNNYKLSGFGISESIGYIGFIGKRLAFSPMLTYGYSRFILLVKNDSLSPVPANGFSSLKQVKYYNAAAVVGLTFDLKFACTSWLGLFLRAQYLYDVSGKYWRQNNGIIGIKDTNSPKTSLTNYSLNAGISFLFNE